MPRNASATLMPTSSRSRVIVNAGRYPGDVYAVYDAYTADAVDDPDFWLSEGAYYKNLEGFGEDEEAMFSMENSPSETPAPVATPSIWDTITGALKTAVPAYLQLQQAKLVQNTNAERAKAGLPPLTASQASSMAPTANVNVGLSPSTQKVLLYAGIAGALGFGAYMIFGRKRRR